MKNKSLEILFISFYSHKYDGIIVRNCVARHICLHVYKWFCFCFFLTSTNGQITNHQMKPYSI